MPLGSGRRVRSLRGRWRPQYTPKLTQRTALLGKLKKIFRRYDSQPVGRVITEISPIGEFDGVDMGGKRFVENKSATGIDKPNPRTGKPQQTASDWAAKQITKKTLARIKALASAAATRGKGGKPVPSIGEIQGFRRIHFMIDGESPALRAAVFAELAGLRTSNPGWTFTAEFGVKMLLPPVPGTGQPDE